MSSNNPPWRNLDFDQTENKTVKYGDRSSPFELNLEDILRTLNDEPHVIDNQLDAPVSNLGDSLCPKHLTLTDDNNNNSMADVTPKVHGN